MFSLSLPSSLPKLPIISSSLKWVLKLCFTPIAGFLLKARSTNENVVEIYDSMEGKFIYLRRFLCAEFGMIYTRLARKTKCILSQACKQPLRLVRVGNTDPNSVDYPSYYILANSPRIIRDSPVRVTKSSEEKPRWTFLRLEDFAPLRRFKLYLQIETISVFQSRFTVSLRIYASWILQRTNVDWGWVRFLRGGGGGGAGGQVGQPQEVCGWLWEG